MITVLHVITRLDVGGSTDETVLCATRMPSAEFASSLISGRSTDSPLGLADKLAEVGVPWLQISHLRRPVAPFADCQALYELWRAFRRMRVDIVHTHTSKAGFLGRLAARLARVPHIVHTPHGHVFHDYFGPVVTRTFVVLERWAARTADRIIVQTSAEASQHLALGIGRPEQYVRIPSGVDLAEVQAAARGASIIREVLRLPAEASLIGAVSRLVPIKGLHYLIAAMPEIIRRSPGTHLVIAGDGEARQALEAQAADLGVDGSVHFLGFRRDVASVIAALDVLILPSLNEGMGRVLIEGMALGVPIVATRVGGVPEVVEDGQQGLLVPPGDPTALATAVVSLLENRPHAATLGIAGRARARLFSLEVMLQALGKLYHEVMADGRSR